MRQRVICVLFVGVTGCGILSPKTAVRREIEVAPYKAWCVGEAETLCLQVREPGEGGFQNLYGAPAGFNFEWGFEYVIVVVEEPREDSSADGSSISRRLDHVVSSSAAPTGTTFELVVTSTWLFPVDEPGLAVSGQSIELDCADVGCGALLHAAHTAPRIAISLRFTQNASGPVQVLGSRVCKEPSGPCTT